MTRPEPARCHDGVRRGKGKFADEFGIDFVLRSAVSGVCQMPLRLSLSDLLTKAKGPE